MAEGPLAAASRPSSEPLRDLGAYGDWAESTDDLLTYRYLASRPRALAPDRAENWLDVRADLRGADGSVLAAPLAITMLDAAGVNVDPVHVLALTHVEVHVLDPARDVATVHLRSRVTRTARTQVFTECLMVDAADDRRTVGFGTASWSVMAPTTGDFRYPEPGAGAPAGVELPPLWQAYTGRRRSDGRLEVPGLSPQVGTRRLHHGPMLVVCEAAAVEELGAAGGAGAVPVEALSLTIVSPARTGPFVTAAHVLPGRPVPAGCRVELVDEGQAGRMVARAFVRARHGAGAG